ncbi:MAG: hypothetical protein J0I47_14305 [Sphingomonas sp.]|uniref:hypothetical protein n=1 Tax=Sphingomonas sp. TaxID=28214 RepID=UPI001AD5F6A0|nr:hypothetical protein [Sphingomonas sp.]MBN8809390.1 hypothetical protein [Sphingomonas sp.]
MLNVSHHYANDRLARHGHREGYAAVVLAGTYMEAGCGPRTTVRAGHVILHDRYDHHQDRFGAGGAVVLNLPLPCGIEHRVGSVEDVDAIAKTAETDIAAAMTFLTDVLRPAVLAEDDWVDELAEGLIANPGRSMAE